MRTRSLKLWTSVIITIIVVVSDTVAIIASAHQAQCCTKDRCKGQDLLECLVSIVSIHSPRYVYNVGVPSINKSFKMTIVGYGINTGWHACYLEDNGTKVATMDYRMIRVVYSLLIAIILVISPPLGVVAYLGAVIVLKELKHAWYPLRDKNGTIL